MSEKVFVRENVCKRGRESRCVCEQKKEYVWVGVSERERVCKKEKEP